MVTEAIPCPGGLAIAAAPRLQGLRFTGPDKGARRRDITQGLGVFAESPAICLGYVWVTFTATSSKPAPESSASYSLLQRSGDAPDHTDARATPGGNLFFSPRNTTSETANRPPGLRTLNASEITLLLRGEADHTSR